METIYSIHPAIGVARVGDSEKRADGSPTQESYYVGPEVPGFDFVPSAYNDTGLGKGKYRDLDGRIRRQGARFRIYEKTVNEMGEVVSAREVTSDDAKITWTVSLANKKGTAERFPPFHHDEWGSATKDRNPGLDEDELNIKPSGPKSISLGQAAKTISGKFLGERIKLGDLITDNKGRLIVLGGHGKIGGDKNADGTPVLWEPAGRVAHALYNNDRICDDTSDGWVTATVKFPGKPLLKLSSSQQRAWVIVAPPNFAPVVNSPVTLYDVVRQACLTFRPDLAAPDTVSFTRDIFPLLRRTVDLKWVSKRAYEGHSGGRGDFLSEETLAILSSTHPEAQPIRQRVFDNFTKPGAVGEEIRMPDLYGGVDPADPRKKPRRPNDPTNRDFYGIPLTITPYMRAVVKLWAKGVFEEDWIAPPSDPAWEDIPTIDRPDTLDKAALEQCSGGSFHPGIEGPYLLAREDTFEGWFRIKGNMGAGELTAGMSVPWQTDFWACSALWWPAQRPNFYPRREEGSVEFVPWLRGINRIADILKLGFIKRDLDTGDVIEDEREVEEADTPLTS